MSHLIQTSRFRDNIVVSIHDHYNQFWLTAEDVGRCLGYAPGNERKGIIAIYNRHPDEFLPEDSTVVKLTTVDEKQRDVRVFSKTGCIKLGFFSATQTAKEFRTWAARVLSGSLTDNRTVAALEAEISRQGWLIAELQDAYHKAYPETLKLTRYYMAGLKQSEMAVLLGTNRSTVRDRLKALAQLGFIDYQPKQYQRLPRAKAQQTLALED